MVRYGIKVKRIIPNVSADYLYTILRDYRNGHPYILPSKYFEDVKIIRGYGIGEGTRIEKVYKIPAYYYCFCYNKRYRMVLDITEPGPGYIIQEIDDMAYNIIRYTIDPIPVVKQSSKLSDHVDNSLASSNTLESSSSSSTSCCVTIEVRMFYNLGIFTIFEMIIRKIVCYLMYTAALEELERFVQQQHDNNNNMNTDRNNNNSTNSKTNNTELRRRFIEEP